MNKDSDSDPTQLRRNAEAHIQQGAAQTPSSPGDAAETSRLVHELQVHQVELELQNHALQKIRRELEESLERYTHLYDFAPVGYATLASGGVIQEINLAGAVLLGTERAHLIGRRFGLFLSEATRPTFNAFLDQALVGVAQQSCQVVLTLESAPPRTVQLEGIGLTPAEDRRCHIVLLDITERKQAEETLRRSEEQYRAIIETSPDGFLMLDGQGHLLEVNEAYAHLSGYRRDELQSMHISELEVKENHEDTLIHMDEIRRKGNDLFETQHRAKSGRIWQVSVNACYWPGADDRFFAFVRDLYHRQRPEILLKIRMRLSQIATSGTLDDVVQAALDEAEHLTSSTIGFFHFVEPDQETLTLQTWSSHTLKVCQALGKGQHYPVSQAGVWADCLRQLRPIIHNDYASLPHLQGLPDGHVPLLRELTLPLLVDGRVAAIIGVGNKPENYTDDDVEAMQQLTDLMMDIIERKHAQNRAEYLAYHDALTQLPNRTLLAAILILAISPCFGLRGCRLKRGRGFASDRHDPAGFEATQHERHQVVPTVEAEVAG